MQGNMRIPKKPCPSLTLAAWGAVAALALPSDAAAIDCRKPSTSTDKAVCSDRELIKLDRDLGYVYQKFIKTYSDAGHYTQLVAHTQAGQEEWLKERDACGADTACIKKAYVQRLGKLTAQVCYPKDGSPIYSTDPSLPTASANSDKPEKPKNACEPLNNDRKSGEHFVTYNRNHMHASDRLIQFLAGFEGYSGCLYDDMAGYGTIGYGHVAKEGMSWKKLRGLNPPTEWLRFKGGIDESYAANLKRKDIQSRALDYIYPRIKVKLNPCQTDALISFTYNAGIPPTLIALINNCQWDKVPDKMREFNKARNQKTGKKEFAKGLDDRRKAEGAMFTACQYEQRPIAKLRCCNYTTHDGKQNYKAYCKQGGTI